MEKPPIMDLKALRENAVALDEAGISPLGVKLQEEKKKRTPPSGLPLHVLAAVAFL